MNELVRQLSAIRVAQRKNEVWRHVDFSDYLTDDMQLPQPTVLADAVPSEQHSLIDGHYHPATHRPSGVDIISMGEARAKGLIGTEASSATNPYDQLNAEHYTDGFFVRAHGTSLSDGAPLYLRTEGRQRGATLTHTRSIVRVEEGCQLSIVRSDEGMDENTGFASDVTEFYLGRNASLAYYEMQNLGSRKALLSQLHVHMEEGATLQMGIFTLNGGYVRNHCEVHMHGEHCNCHIAGLYLMDRKQQTDDYVFVDHQCPNCTSREVFKGIMDDMAHAVFHGHVRVDEGAVGTNASQSNKNILLTDKAGVHAQPFLEIYNDDVICSHGTTTGQLDEQAMFYLRSRGISERTARTLLLYAFCDEVIQTVSLPKLRTRMSDLVKKRLHGELTPCADCVLHCSTPCNGPDANFRIDTSVL